MTPLEPLVLIPAAFLAGVLMFLAPCTLPIVPGYLAFIAGSPKGEKARGRIIRNAIAFVIGFSIVFILLGTFAAALGGIVGPWKDIISRLAGAVIILFGLTMLGVIRLPLIGIERRARVPKLLTLGRPESSALIGILFALGWSPCIGPLLGTILLFASTSATALQGAFLLAVFSAGLGVPFILSAIFLDALGATFVRWSKVTSILSTVGGVVLILLGILMILGDMNLLITYGYSLFNFIGYDRLLQYL